MVDGMRTPDNFSVVSGIRTPTSTTAHQEEIAALKAEMASATQANQEEVAALKAEMTSAAQASRESIAVLEDKLDWLAINVEHKFNVLKYDLAAEENRKRFAAMEADMAVVQSKSLSVQDAHRDLVATARDAARGRVEAVEDQIRAVEKKHKCALRKIEALEEENSELRGRVKRLEADSITRADHDSKVKKVWKTCGPGDDCDECRPHVHRLPLEHSWIKGAEEWRW